MLKEIFMNQPDTLENKAKSMMILAMLIFGTIGIFVRYIPLPSSVIAVGRGIIGTAFLFLFIKGKGIPISWPDIRQNLLLLCLSGAALCGNWTFLFEAYRYTSIATATLCYYMAPIIVILVSPIFLKEKLTARKILCVLTALAGMVLVSGIGQEGGSTNMTGVFFGLCAACCYACIVIFNKKIKPMAAYDKTIVQLGLGALLLMPYVLLTENVTALDASPFSLAMFLVVGVVHTGFAYVFYFGSMQSLKAQTIALFSYLDPIFAILLSAVVLGEPLGMTSIIGAVLVLGSTLVSELKA